MKQYEIDGISFITARNMLVFYATNEYEEESPDAINAKLSVIVRHIGDISHRSILYCNHYFIYNGVIVDEKNCLVDYLIFNASNIHDAMKRILSLPDVSGDSV